MVRETVRDETFLAPKAEPAASEDLPAAQGPLDAPAARKDGRWGMAANMIGVDGRIIVFGGEGRYMVMFDPEIAEKSGPGAGGTG